MNESTWIPILITFVSTIILLLKGTSDRRHNENAAQQYVNIRVQQQDSKIADLESRLNRAHEAREKLEDRVRELELELTSAREITSLRIREVEHLQTQINALGAQYSELSDEFYKTLREKDSVTREINSKALENFKLQADLSNCRSEVVELQQRINALLNKYDPMEGLQIEHTD